MAAEQKRSRRARRTRCAPRRLWDSCRGSCSVHSRRSRALFLICSGTKPANKRRRLMRVHSLRVMVAAALVTAALSGCVVAPAPGHYGGEVVYTAAPAVQDEAGGGAP